MTKTKNGVTDEVDEWHSAICATIIRERDELRAKVERLRGTCEWQLENDRKSAESIARLLAETKRLQAALRQILEDPDALILDSHRDDGWAALGPNLSAEVLNDADD